MGLESLDLNFRELLESLNSAGVKYLVLGGYAVNYYGYHRATDDLDIWVAVDDANATRISNALKSFGFADSAVRSSRFLQKNRVFVFGREPLRVDILTAASGIEFQDCYSRRREVVWDGVRVPLISLGDLKANKVASRRKKDLADIDGLPASVEAPTKRKRKLKRRRRRRKR
jgi:predicted nucleotidyltransferase